MTDKTETPFTQHCIVEIMGHARIAGLVTEQQLAGTAFLRVDVPAIDDIAAFTKFYSSNAIYCITPVNEATCKLAVAALREKPVEEWRFTPPTQLELGGEAPSNDDDHAGYADYGDYADDDNPF